MGSGVMGGMGGGGTGVTGLWEKGDHMGRGVVGLRGYGWGV